ncbi:MAG TPA: DNA gyrase/topoisomerase IV subunit A [Candidatus Onthomorpha intestinigallinarum]|uniref:DNA gyrase/topoisomerase IV subunit A n=1 Tax=Candidatus Onthomorpha intestinigallinarum TaxID=2840880 RepID=A0A9D1UH39_9BACT|nr:DNA gyrase/topoisomerase IV subunit A [Candidatus Onthomorpha intestinigallinarum]
MEENQNNTPSQYTGKTTSIRGMFQDWFLDYASYVILERAVPHINDGLKPVQRRILHSMKELDDGRYNKVANIVGNTMKYHPHGDASIAGALVTMGQKDLLIDCQGNWGNILTGDSAAAPRYIEARLSKFALEVVFNPKTTTWHPSYDGRNEEPDTLPVKFPLLLAQGAEGIAVGLACKILPHNFNELIDASIAILHGEDFSIYPDFPTAGLIDVSKYNDGLQGGRVRVRARIKQLDAKTIVITEIPFTTTADSLIDSIVKACEKNQLKIKKIDNNTAQDVEIRLSLPADTSPDQTIDALYAFTDCEISLSPNSCVIENEKPRFASVSDILRASTQNTVNLLKRELEIKLGELNEKGFWISLERIFIKEGVYKLMEKCTSDEQIDNTITEGLKPFVANLIREVTIEDVHRLRKIPIDRISKYNSDKADDNLKAIKDEIKAVKYDLNHLTDYAVAYFERIKAKYGRERKTEIRNFDYIEDSSVAIANEKLYCNYNEGFVGYKLKNDSYICDCSSMDDVIAIRKDGTFVVRKVQEKEYLGKKLIHVGVYHKNDERTTYNMVYQDGAFGKFYVKRFNITGVIRGKEYSLTKGSKGSRIVYLSVNPNGEAERIKVNLKPAPRMRLNHIEYDFAELAIKSKSAQGNILTPRVVTTISKKSEGVSTLSARKIWFDQSIRRLNDDGRGLFLGEFSGEDRILTVYASGHYRLTNYDLSNHFDDDLLVIEKFNSEKPVSLFYLEAESKCVYFKRFLIEQSNKKINIFEEQKDSKLICVSTDWRPVAEIDGKEVVIEDLGDIKKYRAKGKKISKDDKCDVKFTTPLPYEEKTEDKR